MLDHKTFAAMCRGKSIQPAEPGPSFGTFWTFLRLEEVQARTRGLASGFYEARSIIRYRQFGGLADRPAACNLGR
jgi:hypothetical protein